MIQQGTSPPTRHLIENINETEKDHLVLIVFLGSFIALCIDTPVIHSQNIGPENCN